MKTKDQKRDPDLLRGATIGLIFLMIFLLLVPLLWRVRSSGKGEEPTRSSEHLLSSARSEYKAIREGRKSIIKKFLPPSARLNLPSSLGEKLLSEEIGMEDVQIERAHIKGGLGIIFCSFRLPKEEDSIRKEVGMSPAPHMKFVGMDIWRYESGRWIDIKNPIERRSIWLSVSSDWTAGNDDESDRLKENLKINYRAAEEVMKRIPPLRGKDENAAKKYANLIKLYAKEARDKRPPPDSPGIDIIFEASEMRYCRLYPAYYREWSSPSTGISVPLIFIKYAETLALKSAAHLRRGETDISKSGYRALIRYGQHLLEDRTVAGISLAGCRIREMGLLGLAAIAQKTGNKKEREELEAQLLENRELKKAISELRKVLEDIRGADAEAAQMEAARGNYDLDTKKTAIMTLAARATKGYLPKGYKGNLRILIAEPDRMKRLIEFLRKVTGEDNKSSLKEYVDYCIETALCQWVYTPQGRVKF